jgi:hypothetical protein
MYFESRVLGRPLVWLKTTHLFPSPADLAEYWTSISDLLIKDGMVSKERVEAVMQDLGTRSLPRRLRELGLIDEPQFTSLWSRFSKIPERTVILSDIDPELFRIFPESESHRFDTIPVRNQANGQIELAFVEPPSAENGAALEELLGSAPALCLITQTNLRILRDNGYAANALSPFRLSMVDQLPDDEKITWRAAKEIHSRTGNRVADVAVDLGLISASDCRKRWAELFGAEVCDLPRETLDKEAFESLGPVFCSLHRFAPLVGNRLVAQELLHPDVINTIHEKLGRQPQLVADLASTTRRFLRDVFEKVEPELILLQCLLDDGKLSAIEAEDIRSLRQVLNEPIHVLVERHTRVSEMDLRKAFANISGLPFARSDAKEIAIDLMRPDFSKSTRSRILEAENGRVTFGLSNLLSAKDFSQICSRLTCYAIRFLVLPAAN